MELKRMRPRVVRAWISVWLLLQVVTGMLTWSRVRGARLTTLDRSDMRMISLVLLVLGSVGLVLILRTRLGVGARSWRLLTGFFGVTALCLVLLAVGGAFLGRDDEMWPVLVGFGQFGLIQAMVWGKLRESITQKIWESDEQLDAGVFD